MASSDDDSNPFIEFTTIRNPLKRIYGHGDLHFVTFSCYRRLAFLGTSQSRDCFEEILDRVRDRHQFRIFGYVVMPEHVHLLIDEPSKVTPSAALQVLKRKVSSELGSTRPTVATTQRIGRPDSRQASETPVWQRRFYDFNVWSPAKIKES